MLQLITHIASLLKYIGVLHVYRQIALKTEGFQVGDLVKVVDRAISCVQIRNTCPEALNTAASSPVTKRHSKIFDDVGSGGGTSPLTTRSLPSSPLRKHHQLKNVKSLSPPLNQKRRSVHHINLSTLTLVERTQNYLEFDQDGRMKLTERDFRVALNGFVPLTLHGLSLHSTGSIDFSRVGGMKGIKKVLRETILWPSKVRGNSHHTVAVLCQMLLSPFLPLSSLFHLSSQSPSLSHPLPPFPLLPFFPLSSHLLPSLTFSLPLPSFLLFPLSSQSPSLSPLSLSHFQNLTLSSIPSSSHSAPSECAEVSFSMVSLGLERLSLPVLLPKNLDSILSV